MTTILSMALGAVRRLHGPAGPFADRCITKRPRRPAVLPCLQCNWGAGILLFPSIPAVYCGYSRRVAASEQSTHHGWSWSLDKITLAFVTNVPRPSGSNTLTGLPVIAHLCCVHQRSDCQYKLVLNDGRTRLCLRRRTRPFWTK